MKKLVIPCIFILGFSLCVSTALMTNAYFFLVFLSFWQKDFLNKLKNSLRNKFVLMAIIFYSIYVIASLWSNASFHDIWKMLIHIIFYFVPPFLFIIFSSDKKNTNTLLIGFVSGAFLTAFLSCISALFHHRILYGIHDNKYTVFHGHVLHNAFLAIAATILLITILNDNNLKIRIYSIIAYLVCCINVFFVVDGRTGMLMLIVMNIFAAICFIQKKYFLRLFFLTLAILVVLWQSPIVQLSINNYKSDMTKYSNGNVSSSMGYRMVFHHVSNELIKQKPFFGRGTGSYSNNFNNYAQQHNLNITNSNPHRDILLIGVETGALGMIVFILMLFSGIYEVIKLDKYYRVIGLSLILGYVSASVENSFFMDNVTGITFMVLLLAIMSSPKTENCRIAIT